VSDILHTYKPCEWYSSYTTHSYAQKYFIYWLSPPKK
jgi:hypothetical protein